MIDGANLNATSGISTVAALTVTGNVSVGGTLTYQDVTNIDSVGVITARSGVNISGGNLQVGGTNVINSGRVLYNLEQLKLADTKQLVLGSSDDLKIYHDGSWNYIQSYNSKNFVIQVKDNENAFVAIPDGEVQLYHNNVNKFETTSSGVKVSGSFPDFIIHDTDTTNDNFRLLHNGGGTQLQVDPNNVGPNASHFIVGIDGTERLRIDSAGRLLLGTTTEGESNADTLTIAESGNAGITIRSGSSATGSIYFSDATSGGGEYDGWIAYNQNSRYLQFGTAQTERLRIQPSGYVGIGEDAPGGKLTVKHTNTATSGLNATLKLKQGVATNGNRSSLIFSSLDDYDVAAVNGVVEVHSGTSANNVGRLEFWTKASGSNAAERVRITSDGHVLPGANNTYDLGSTAKGWRNVYMNDLNLSNMNGDTNDVDGTQGSWTIQEGKDDLYIINRLNGKKFKIKMEEIS